MLKKEHNRQLNKGRQADHFFCSLSCNAIWNNKNCSEEALVNRTKHLKQYNGPNTRKKGNFTIYLNRVNQRNKKKSQETDLDEKYLQELWNRQAGKCALTGIPIELIYYTTRLKPTSASLDRIDSDLGYVKGNVQFVAVSMNLGKTTFSNDQMVDFVKLILENG